MFGVPAECCSVRPCRSSVVGVLELVENGTSPCRAAAVLHEPLRRGAGCTPNAIFERHAASSGFSRGRSCFIAAPRKICRPPRESQLSAASAFSWREKIWATWSSAFELDPGVKNCDA